MHSVDSPPNESVTRSQCYYTWLLTSVTASLQTHVHVRCKRWPAFFCFALFVFVLLESSITPSNKHTIPQSVVVQTMTTVRSLTCLWPQYPRACDGVTSAVSFAFLIQIPARQESGEILSQEMFSEIFTVTSHRGHWSGTLADKEFN